MQEKQMQFITITPCYHTHGQAHFRLYIVRSDYTNHTDMKTVIEILG